MRLRVYAGLLGLGLSLGALLCIHIQNSSYTETRPPVVEEYVRLVSLLYAKGESLETVQARLDLLGYPNSAAVVQEVVHLSADSPEEAARASVGDLSTMLIALAPEATPATTSPQRLIASGRGASETPVVAAQRPPEVLSAAAEFPATGIVFKGDSHLRTMPSLDSTIAAVVPQGSEVELLAVEHGQPIEGAEDRWYRVKHGDATGYLYYSLVELRR
ncbi:MAG: SH3 domain-containing protein [Chloroflexota bacterium]